MLNPYCQESSISCLIFSPTHSQACSLCRSLSTFLSSAPWKADRVILMWGDRRLNPQCFPTSSFHLTCPSIWLRQILLTSPSWDCDHRSTNRKQTEWCLLGAVLWLSIVSWLLFFATASISLLLLHKSSINHSFLMGTPVVLERQQGWMGFSEYLQ